MKCSFLKRSAKRAVLAVGVLLVGSAFLQSCQDDLLTGQPSWLGNSIYEYLQEQGDYKYTLRLIDDLKQTETMSKTGSKTLFVANDDAYEEFFKNNSWGVKSYAELSTAQKRLLLNSAMINNAYLVELLANVSVSSSNADPILGKCMRRNTASDLFDSIPRVMPADMPSSPYWDEVRNRPNGIILLQDDSRRPMIHFLPKFMEQNGITNSDLQILTNGGSNSITDAWVNGVKIIERDITCKNGYVHKLEKVMAPPENMSAIIHNKPEMSQYASLLDRFSAPYYDSKLTQNYHQLYGTDDSVFVLKYFATLGNGGKAVSTLPDGKTSVSASLQFDPGWNQYNLQSIYEGSIAEDCAAMLVPSNNALNEWWTNGGGTALRDEYGSWENVPDNVLYELIDVNMIPTFLNHIPSKFNTILNDAKVSMGVTTDNVKASYMGCNGVVYQTDRVFGPASYSSVFFPVLVHRNSTTGILCKAIEDLEFKAYLNSMDALYKYSLIMPEDNAFLTYVDPCSYGATRQVLYKFFLKDNKLGAERYYYNAETGEIGDLIDTKNVTYNNSTGKPSGGKDNDVVLNRLNDIIDNLIIIGDITDGHQFYKTKGGATLKVENNGSITLYGSGQLENGTAVVVDKDKIYSKQENGQTYTVNQLPVSGKQSVSAILQKHPEYSAFYELISGGTGNVKEDLMVSVIDGKYGCVDENVRIFDKYNYTVYVPTNETIEKLHAEKKLPTWDDYNAQDELWGDDEAGAAAAKKAIKERIEAFVKYHIQDNSLYIGGANQKSGPYETGMLNTKNRKFYKLDVNVSDNAITVKGEKSGNVRHVLTSNKELYNNMCREYQYTVSDKETAYTGYINASSYAVVHQIDGPLFFDDTFDTPLDYKTASPAKHKAVSKKTVKRTRRR